MFSPASCQKTGLQYASAEDQQEDGASFSHCLPLFTEQLHKVGFYAIHWDRQERHLHTATASGGILVAADATTKGEQFTTGTLHDNLYAAITLYISCMKTNQCIAMTSLLSEEHRLVFATKYRKSYIQVLIFIFLGLFKTDNHSKRNLKGQLHFFTITKHKSQVPVTWELHVFIFNLCFKNYETNP